MFLIKMQQIIVLKHNSKKKELFYQQHTKSEYLQAGHPSKEMAEAEQEVSRRRNLFMNNNLFSLGANNFFPPSPLQGF